MALLLAASVTPLRDGGAALDEDAIGPMVDFLEAGGVDGLFALGTTGEGVLLSLDERMRAAIAFREACDGTLIVHCGAQSTADTVALAAHAASIGVDGVAVIPPPYYPFGPDAVLAHLAAAAGACDPVPFYPYAFAARSGYRLEPSVVEGLRDRVAQPRRPQGLGGAVRPRRSLPRARAPGLHRLRAAHPAGARGRRGRLRLGAGGSVPRDRRRGRPRARRGGSGSASRAARRDRALSVSGRAQGRPRRPRRPGLARRARPARSPRRRGRRGRS